MKVNKLTISITTAILALAVTMCPTMGEAGNPRHSDFPGRVSVSGVPMTLQGTGVKSVAFIKAFTAALYKEDGANVSQGGKKLIVQYFVKIPAKKLSKFTIDSMRQNVSQQRMDEIAVEIQRMSELFVDLKPGDEFALAYVPGVGTQFIYNGELTGTIKGQAFAEALYSVWIGDKPFDKKLKRAILGNDRKKGLPLFAQSQ